jgi:DNA end-binding protein Ku
MKAIWKGRLSLGLVDFPIKLYSAVESHALGFKLLHEKCKKPVNYQRYCPKCDKIVAWEDIVKGMELPDGSFFVITQEKLEKLKPESTDVITIVEFVDPLLIAPIYFNSHYYLAPTKITEKAYFLLAKIMEDLDRVAVGTFVMREKQYACVISPYENGFLLSTLHYTYEIRPMSKIEELSVSVRAQATKKEEELARKLVEKMTKKTFDISEFKDTFSKALREQIERAIAGKKIIKKRAAKAVKEREISLTESLQRSVEEFAPKRKRTEARSKR